MRYGSVCSGIEAATVAWHPLGWKPAFFSEIEAAPRAVITHHYPATPLHGDFTTIKGDEYGPIDLLVGGTPCQDFSVAGLRAGLDGDRGNLSLEFLRLADRTRPRWLVWENVPGVLSIDGGRAFGAILGGLAELGYGFAYRILDAQHFGVPQRRRRVFVVGYLGDHRRAGAVLFERHSLQNAYPPKGPPRENLGGTITSRPKSGGWSTDVDMAAANWMQVASCGRPYMTRPIEWERAFGFPDDYTLVPNRGKPMADGPRYKALGNSMAVPVMRWIGERIQMVEKLALDA